MSKNSETTKKHDLSYIEVHEEQEAKDFIKSHLGFEPIRPAGYHLLVKLYIRPETYEGSSGIAISNSTRANDKWVSCTALVLAIGPDAYKGARFEKSGPWCKVGDWVMIPRNEGIQFNDHGSVEKYGEQGIAMQLIPDDRIVAVVDDPARISRD